MSFWTSRRPRRKNKTNGPTGVFLSTLHPPPSPLVKFRSHRIWFGDRKISKISPIISRKKAHLFVDGHGAGAVALGNETRASPHLDGHLSFLSAFWKLDPLAAIETSTRANTCLGNVLYAPHSVQLLLLFWGSTLFSLVFGERSCLVSWCCFFLACTYVKWKYTNVLNVRSAWMYISWKRTSPINGILAVPSGRQVN